MSEIITLIAPEGFTDVSFGGENYTVEDGRVSVPREAAEFLYSFGFGNAPQDAGESEQEPEKQTNGEQAQEPEKQKRGRQQKAD